MREKSLKNDANDQRALRRSRHQHLGICVSSEFYQPCPMFFTREGSQLNIIGQYRGASVFVIMNGPSLKDIDLQKLDQAGVMTYGVNNGPKTYRPNLWSCVDPPDRFIKSIWLDPKIQKIVPMDFFEKNIFDNEKWKAMKKRVGECPNVIGFRRNEKFMAQRFLWEDTINWGNHKDYGGGRSVFLATMRIVFLLGFRKVYLLGCDFNMNSDQTYHFEENRTNSAIKCNTNTYKKMNEEYFAQLKPEFEIENFEVYNCNPNSGLTVFPHKSVDEAIAEATFSVGDVVNERTYGMYTNMDDRDKHRNDPEGVTQTKGSSAVKREENPEDKKEKQEQLKQRLEKAKASQNVQVNKTQVNSPEQFKKQPDNRPKPAPEFAEMFRKQKDQKGGVEIKKPKPKPKHKPAPPIAPTPFNEVAEKAVEDKKDATNIQVPQESAFTSTLSKKRE
jgi:hypothetical protein